MLLFLFSTLLAEILLNSGEGGSGATTQKMMLHVCFSLLCRPALYHVMQKKHNL